jgi:hypothetical protein
MSDSDDCNPFCPTPCPVHQPTPKVVPDLEDGAPEVQAWDHERIRLQLAAACALKALFGHMAEPAAIFIPYDGQMLEVRKVFDGG